MRLLIFTNYFYPAHKGGGPIQSLINLIEYLPPQFEIFIVCSARDLGDSTILPDIKINEWNDYKNSAKVFYSELNVQRAIRVLKDVDPGIVYISGFFSAAFNLLPLVVARLQNRKTILAPRGMLQQGALSGKPIKKKAVLFLFKVFGLHRYLRWHATDQQEVIDINKIFGIDIGVEVASNIPKRPIRLSFDDPTSHSENFPKDIKRVGSLKLVYLSLISEKKNLHLIVEALQRVTKPIQFHIYGPIKDKFYWERVQNLIQESKHEIQYFGSIDPSKVQNTLANYDAMILPTKGENFGHAIYESLGAGTPVILSQYTPWGRLQDYQAGLTVESFEPSDWALAIEKFINMDEDEYMQLSKGAYLLATDYFSKNEFASQYRMLFS